jgi:hypothetical protein
MQGYFANYFSESHRLIYQAYDLVANRRSIIANGTLCKLSISRDENKSVATGTKRIDCGNW